MPLIAIQFFISDEELEMTEDEFLENYGNEMSRIFSEITARRDELNVERMVINALKKP